MNRENARKISYHREVLVDSPKESCVVFYDGHDSELDLEYTFSSGFISNLKNVLQSQYYIFGPGVYYLTVSGDEVFKEEFVACLYSDKFPLGKVVIDLDGDRVYEYNLEDSRVY